MTKQKNNKIELCHKNVSLADGAVAKEFHGYFSNEAEAALSKHFG